MQMTLPRQGPASRNLTGIGTAVALHLLLGYAFMSGLAGKVATALKKPVEVSLIEEIKPDVPLPLPPPKAKLPEPPPQEVPIPPPAYVPPPEVVVEVPPAPNVIAAVTSMPPPPQEVVVAPVPVAPKQVAVGVVCPNHAEVRSRVTFPPQAMRLGLSGDVLIEFTVATGGEVKDVTVARSTHTAFNDAAIQAVKRFRCNGIGQEARVRVPFAFRLER